MVTQAISTFITTNYQKFPMFDIFTCNKKLFAIFLNELDYKDSIHIDLKDYHVIFLAPISAKKDIIVDATTCICLSTLTTTDGKITIRCSDKCILLGATLQGKTEAIKIQATEEPYCVSCTEAKQLSILNKIIDASDTTHGPSALKGLFEIHEAIDDPTASKTTVDILAPLRFFGIPLS